MGWITRRVVGYIVFAVVTAILGSIAILRGDLAARPDLSTVCGILILGIAFLVSLLVTTSMKRWDLARKAAEENAKAWQEYYARMRIQQPPPRP